MTLRTILLVDDDVVWLKVASRFLSVFNFTVYTAQTCLEAKRLASLYRPACILLDLHLSDGTAADVCAYVRSEEKLKTTPIVVLSGGEDEKIECSADRFLLKCVPFKDIVRNIEELIGSDNSRIERK